MPRGLGAQVHERLYADAQERRQRQRLREQTRAAELQAWSGAVGERGETRCSGPPAGTAWGELASWGGSSR